MTPTLDLSLLDAADERAVDELQDFELRRWALDEPHDPPPTRRQTAVDATVGWAPGRRETWLARRGGRLAGTVRLTLCDVDNLHMAEVYVAVDPQQRRQGVGTELLAFAAERAREDGRRLLIGEASPGTSAASFAEGVGAACALVEVRRRLDLAAVDVEGSTRDLEDARRHARDYEVLTWSGPTPEELLEPVAGALRAMNDAPTDDLDYQDEAWTPDRIRWVDSYRASRDDRWHTTVARHRQTGQLAALTEVEVRGDSDPLAYQGNTCVVPDHRGHRLGLVVKLELLLRLRRLEPEVRHIDTWNAASNTHMIAINEQMGYRLLRTEAEWQIDVDAVPGRTAQKAATVS